MDPAGTVPAAAGKLRLRIFAAVFTGILLAPAFGIVFPHHSRQTLDGVEQAAPFPVFSVRGWFDGTYQKGFEDWYGQVFGFREYLVRTANQVNFSLFSEITYKEGSRLILGKDNHLFQAPVIDAYTGRDLLPEGKCEEFARGLKALQDRLQARGIAFLFFLTPGKASICPEVLPEGVKPGPGRRNYDALVPLLKRQGVNTLDGRAFMASLKETCGYPVFPRGGAHWNHYASLRVTQELISRMEGLWGRPMVRLKIEGCEMAAKAVGSDRDLARLANVWRPSVFYGVNPYPVVGRESPPGAARPDALLVGGSFLDLPVHWLTRYGVIDERAKFDWYFRGRAGDPDRDLEGRDIVILETNEASIGMLGYGFIEAVLARGPR